MRNYLSGQLSFCSDVIFKILWMQDARSDICTGRSRVVSSARQSVGRTDSYPCELFFARICPVASCRWVIKNTRCAMWSRRAIVQSLPVGIAWL